MSKKKNKIKRTGAFILRKKRFFLILLAIIISAIALSSIGKQVNFIFPLHLAIEDPISSCENINVNNKEESQQVSVIIDKQGQRVSILNSDRKVHSQIMFNIESDILIYAESAYRYGDDVYIYGYTTIKEAAGMTGARLVHYNADGEFIDIPYEYDFKNGEYRKVAEVYKKNEDLFIVSFYNNHVFEEQVIKNESFNEDESKYSLKLISSFEVNNLLVEAFYIPSIQSTVYIDEIGTAYIKSQDSFDKVDFNELLLYGDYNSLKFKTVFEKDISENSTVKLIDRQTNESIYIHIDASCVNFDYDNNTLAYVDYDNNQIYNINLLTGTIDIFTSFNYELQLLVDTLVVWIARILAIAIVCFIFVYWIIQLKKHEGKKFLNFIIGLSVFFAIIIATGFINYMFYDYCLANLKSNLTSITQAASNSFEYNNDELNYSIFDEKVVGKQKADENKNNFEKFSRNIEQITNSFTNNNLRVSYNFYGYDPNSNSIQYISGLGILSTNGYQIDNIEDNNIKLLSEEKTVTGVARGKYNNYIYSCAPLYNHNKTMIGAIEFQSSIRLLNHQLNDMFFFVLLTLVLSSIVIYLLISLCVRFAQSTKIFKEKVASKFEHSEIYITPTIAFLRNFIINADSIMCVLITKSMLEPYGLGDDGIFLAIPLGFSGFGAFLIGLMFNKLYKKINIKKAYLINISLMTIFLAFEAYSVYINNIVLYVIFKFLSSFYNGAVYVSDTSLPMCIDDEELRFKTLREITLSDISSPILSVFFAGILSSYLGDYTIYIMCAVIGAIMLLIALLFMPSNAYFKNIDANKRNVSFKTLMKFFFSPEIISATLIFFVCVTISGYKSYLFPLYNADLNISSSDMSNYFTIVMALALLVSRWIDSFERRFDHWRRIIIYLCMIGVVFCLFITNTSLIWALITLFLVSVIQKITVSEWRVVWPRKCNEMNIDPVPIQSDFVAIEYACISLRQFALGTLLVFGSGGACVALGIVIFIATLIFYLFTKNTSLSKS